MLRALLIFVFNLWSLTRVLMRKLIELLPFVKPRQRRYVKLKLPEGLALEAKARRIGPITLGRGGAGAWWAFDKLVDKLARDESIEGVYIKLGMARVSMAEGRALTNRLDALRAAGKRVVCHMDQGMMPDYLLATGADTLLMSPPGRLYTFGLNLSVLSLGAVLKKVGVEASFVNLGRYKTAMHRFTRERMSSHQAIMMRQLLHGLSGSVLARISQGRGVEPATARALLDAAPMPAREARRAGLIDGMVYSDQIKETLEEASDCDREVKLMSTGAWLRQASPEFKWRSTRKRPQVAVLSLRGTIMHDGPGPSVRKGLTPKPVIEALTALRQDKSVKAVVVHIDSPGGSALASDLIWRQLRKLADTKPVIASLGNVAASGGYYLAVGAHEIFALPESITGSIGVIAGKLSGGELLEKLGVRYDHMRVGATAGFGSLDTPLSEAELANLRRDIRAFYRRFLHRVWKGRGIPRRRLHRLARGRVYTGAQARRVGLVDSLGDLNDAIDRACQKAGLERDQVKVRFVDHRDTGIKKLLQQNAAGAELLWEGEAAPASARADLLDELMPEALGDAVAAAVLLRQPSVLAMSPYLPTMEVA
jgi:protease-4